MIAEALRDYVGWVDAPFRRIPETQLNVERAERRNQPGHFLTPLHTA